MENKFRNILLISLLFFVLILFSLSLFKNISYPLLWNDEAETAMFATRILEYGYPKVNDGKNVLNLLEHEDKSLGVKQKYDAFKDAIWGQYYFAVPAVLLAHKVGDIYLKTALIRIPFAAIGFLGLLIIVLPISKLFAQRLRKILFLILFFGLELFSISLILHLRDARYHSLLIFLTGLIFYLYFQYYIFKKINFWIYTVLLSLFLLLVFNTFFPAYFPLLITFALTSFFESKTFNIKKKSRLNKEKFGFLIKQFLPLLISFLITLPFFIFFEAFNTSKEISKLYHFNFQRYLENLCYFLRFFNKYEFLTFALVIKSILILLTWKLKKKTLKIRQMLRVSNTLSLFFVIYALVISRSPLIYERYFIVLQPILTVIFLLDAFIIFQFKDLKQAKNYFLFLMMVFLLITSDRLHKIYPFKSYFYELTHQYKGPLDFAIPYIKKTFLSHEDLVIATNYEEFSFMYYLDCKVIIGQGGHNLSEDIKLKPDIIISRKGWRSVFPEEMDLLLKNSRYQKVSFPVYDYRVNNIPELYYPIFHLFKTRFAENPDEALDIYIKQ